MMKKYMLLMIGFIWGGFIHGQSAIADIRNSELIRHTIRFAAAAVYNHDFCGGKEVRRFASPERKTALILGSVVCFHNTEGSLDAYCNFFNEGGVRGVLYTVSNKYLRKKIFIAFPGTTTTIEWAKNLFGITSFGQNVQQSYQGDVGTLYSADGDNSFTGALKRHINFCNSKRIHDEHNDPLQPRPDVKFDSTVQPSEANTYEYYFTGHSRGGALAFLAARKFKESMEKKVDGVGDLAIGSIKVVTFCSPKLANAHITQLDFVERLGFENIVHFARHSDIAPTFPFRFVENYGVKIPLESSFGSLSAHKLPDEGETDRSVASFRAATSIGWWDPVRSLFIPGFKSLLWGIGGAYVCYIMPGSTINAIIETLQFACLKTFGFWPGRH